MDVWGQVEEFVKSVNFFLAPFGVTVSMEHRLWDTIKTLNWRTYCRAKGQYWNESVIEGEVSDETLLDTDPMRVAIKVLWSVHARVNERAPRADEVEFRSSEVTPEDFYAM